MRKVEIGKDDVLHILDATKEYFLNISKVVLIKASGNYSDIYLCRLGQYGRVRILIGDFEKALQTTYSPHLLMRVDRSTIINLRRIEDIKVNSQKCSVFIRQDGGLITVEVAKKAYDSLKKDVEFINSKGLEKQGETNTAKLICNMLSRYNRMYMLVKRIMGDITDEEYGKYR